jgi:hypothetical protein
MASFYIGADFGLSRDYSTIAVIERAELRGAYDFGYRAYKKAIEMRLRALERLPLGTPYAEVAERVAWFSKQPALGGSPDVIADATGVGEAVLELVRMARPAGRLKPVIVSTGDHEHFSKGHYNVPKRDLIVGLQVAFQQQSLRIPHGLTEGETFTRELASMEVRVTSGGREQYGAWRQGTHDDLVFAVALAWWGAREAHPAPDEFWLDRREAERAEEFRGYFKDPRG